MPDGSNVSLPVRATPGNLLPDYAEFLARKAPRMHVAGFEPDPFPAHLFDYQQAATAFCLRLGRAALFLDTGLGKALASDTNVVTPTGLRPIASLQVDDLVIGADGQPTAVVGVFPQGTRSGYRVGFSDDTSVVCDLEHLWNVRTKVQKYRDQGYQTLTLGQILERGLRSDGKNGSGAKRDRLFIPMVGPVAFEEVPDSLPLHPYVLGCLIGDGGLTGFTPRFTSADNDLVDRIKLLLPAGVKMERVRYSKYDWSIVGTLGGNRYEQNRVTDALSDLGLHGSSSPDKFVPMSYKLGDADTRLAVIQGLLDTDGSCWLSNGSPVVEYCTTSKRLAEDFVFLVQSLGGKGRIREKRTTHRLAYRVTPAFPKGIRPFWLPRKSSLYGDRTKYMPARAFESVEQIGNMDMTCIKVAASDGLFVVEGFIVTHNTACELEFAAQCARRTGLPSLILTPLAVARQIEREGLRWGYEARVIREQEDVGPGINICNYDRLDKLDPAAFGCVVLDESGVLKSFMGRTTQALISMFARTPYRLAATATPAPNDHVELGTHAEFLGVMPQADMLVRWFVNDSADTGTWRLKGHAARSFWDWCASWAVMAETPEDLGFDGSRHVLPEMVIHRHKVAGHIKAKDGDLFAGDVSATSMHAVKRQTAQSRAADLAALVRADSQPWLIWVDINDEADAVRAVLPEAQEVRGSMKPEAKEQAIAGFLDGSTRVLIGKASALGYGLNLQNCASMVFLGRSFSYEQWYQAVRRCWRFGQTRPVHVHLMVAEGEDQIGRVLARKAEGHAVMKQAMREATRRAAGRSSQVRVPYQPRHIGRLPGWLA